MNKSDILFIALLMLICAGCVWLNNNPQSEVAVFLEEWL